MYCTTPSHSKHNTSQCQGDRHLHQKKHDWSENQKAAEIETLSGSVESKGHNHVEPSAAKKTRGGIVTPNKAASQAHQQTPITPHSSQTSRLGGFVPPGTLGAGSTPRPSQHCEHRCLGCEPRLKTPLVTSRNFTKLLRADPFTCSHHRKIVRRLLMACPSSCGSTASSVLIRVSALEREQVTTKERGREKEIEVGRRVTGVEEEISESENGGGLKETVVNGEEGGSDCVHENGNRMVYHLSRRADDGVTSGEDETNGGRKRSDHEPRRVVDRAEVKGQRDNREEANEAVKHSAQPHRHHRSSSGEIRNAEGEWRLTEKTRDSGTSKPTKKGPRRKTHIQSQRQLVNSTPTSSIFDEDAILMPPPSKLPKLRSKRRPPPNADRSNPGPLISGCGSNARTTLSHAKGITARNPQTPHRRVHPKSPGRVTVLSSQRESQPGPSPRNHTPVPPIRQGTPIPSRCNATSGHRHLPHLTPSLSAGGKPQSYSQLLQICQTGANKSTGLNRSAFSGRENRRPVSSKALPGGKQSEVAEPLHDRTNMPAHRRDQLPHSETATTCAVVKSPNVMCARIEKPSRPTHQAGLYSLCHQSQCAGPRRTGTGSARGRQPPSGAGSSSSSNQDGTAERDVYQCVTPAKDECSQKSSLKQKVVMVILLL